MKVIKKITAIMLSIMMVLGMSSVVSAAATTGSITINNAAPGETYNIYRILDLESYNGSGKSGNYAYKLRSDNATGSIKSWSDFINLDEIKGTSGYVTLLDGDYVTWKEGASVEAFAQKALAYATNNTTTIAADKKETAPEAPSGATTSTVSFSGLPLGYYLVETSVGTVIALNTTNSTWTIDDKNVAPTVEKKVSKTENGAYEDKSTASIGDTVYFKTTIAAKKGARNYELHDTMSNGLTFNMNSIVVKKDATQLNSSSDYELVTDDTAKGDSCTFHIKFTESFCNSITADTNIIITYSATLNENANIGPITGNTNTTYLKYGDNSKTKEDKTTTYTYEVPVFKYTKDGSGNKIGRADAVFTISTQRDGSNPIYLRDITAPTATDKIYQVEVGATGSNTEVTTPSTGNFTIQGLDEGTYYLTETKQPAGYNKLTSPVKIIIKEGGKITIGASSNIVDKVEVENKSGSLLPSTGGRGTTLFYILGAILVVGSGVVLITKKRMK